MRNRIPVVVLAVLGVIAGGAVAASTLAGQTVAPPDQGASIPGCAIPRNYGRLVAVLPGNNAGLAGQAVFEGEDGTIRWVPMMFRANEVITPKAARGPSPIFPSLPLYDCVTGAVWQRP